MSLLNKKCVPCDGRMAPLDKAAIAGYMKELKQEWQVYDDDKKIRREFRFNNFKEGMAFVNKVAELAEMENHHPDVYLTYKTVVIDLWTHAIGGLSENDFIMARKIEAL